MQKSVMNDEVTFDSGWGAESAKEGMDEWMKQASNI